MTENDKIVITELNNKMILCHIKNDKAVDIFAYQNIVEDFPIGTIVNGVIEKRLEGIDASFVRYNSKSTGYINGDFKCGTIIPVMYKKERIGKKNPLFTDKISVSGFYAVVFDDQPYIKISSKISKEKSKELREKYIHIAYEYNVGILLRTACEDVDTSERDIISDEIINLCKIINKIKKDSPQRVAYSQLYKPNPQLVIDCAELIKKGVNEIISDNQEVCDLLSDSFNNELYNMHNNINIRYYNDSLLSLSKLYSFESKLSEATSRIVYLKSGANITFDQTEALMAIDVNSASAKYKKDRESSILDINKEAFSEIARQLRLRNIAGIIIVDFINMKMDESYNLLSEHISRILKNDRVTCNYHGFTKLGLAEISRQKERTTLFEQLR